MAFLLHAHLSWLGYCLTPSGPTAECRLLLPPTRSFCIYKCLSLANCFWASSLPQAWGWFESWMWVAPPGGHLSASGPLFSTLPVSVLPMSQG